MNPVSGRACLVADTGRPGLPDSPPGSRCPGPEESPPQVFRRLSPLPPFRGRLRLVPYSAVGTDRGLLVCFRPDRLTVEGRQEDMLIALSPTPLSEAGNIPPWSDPAQKEVFL